MQGRVQKWVDHSISVTINLPRMWMKNLSTGFISKHGAQAVRAARYTAMAHVRECLYHWKEKAPEPSAQPMVIAHKRPNELEADVVRFQNNKEKWIAFIGLRDGKPYEIFTGLADDEDGIFCPKSVSHGKIIKAVDENGNKRYDFQFINKRGYKTTIEGPL